MQKNILALLLNIILSVSLPAQPIIKGKVVDAVSRQPLEAVLITDNNAAFKNTVTDQNGNFILRSTKELLVSYIGYRTATFTVKKNEGILIALQPDVVNLKDIVLQNNSNTKFTTISKIDLDLKPVKNTQELLIIVPGLFIAQHAGGGKAEQIFLRGFDCDHGTDVQVSVDELPVNMVSHAHGQGYADAHFIIPETINNIDFGAGPYYTQHGNFNTAGYVSFATFKNIAKNLVQVEAGRFNSFRNLFMIDIIKKDKDKQSAYIAADFNYSDGPTIKKQNFKRLNLFGKYNLSLSDNTQLTASVSTFTSNWNASGQIPERAVEKGIIDRFGSIDPSEGGNTERHNANVILKHSFKNGSNWESQLFYTRYKFNLFSNFTFYLNDQINGDEINQAESRYIFGYSSKLNHKYFFGSKQLNSTYGVGSRYDATSESRLSNAIQRKLITDIKLGDITETNAFLFIQQELIFNKWLFDAGVRLDYFHFNYFDKLNTTQQPFQQKAIVSPKLNIQYTINQKIQLFAKVGKGFHSNDTRVVVANKGKEILPAAYGADFGVVFKPAKSILINIAAWHLYLDQEFIYVGDDGNIEPSGKSRRQGIDITARYQVTKNVFANANFNFTKPRAIGAAKGVDYIPLAPTFTSTGGIYYKAQKGFNGGLNYRCIKNRPANEDNSIIAKGYYILDAAVNYTKEKFEVGLTIENILNIKWNEAQFATESRLLNEPAPVTELNYTPGSPFFARLKFAVFF